MTVWDIGHASKCKTDKKFVENKCTKIIDTLSAGDKKLDTSANSVPQ